MLAKIVIVSFFYSTRYIQNALDPSRQIQAFRLRVLPTLRNKKKARGIIFVFFFIL